MAIATATRAEPEHVTDIVERVHDTLKDLVTTPLHFALVANCLGYFAHGAGCFETMLTEAISGAAEAQVDLEEMAAHA